MKTTIHKMLFVQFVLIEAGLVFNCGGGILSPQPQVSSISPAAVSVGSGNLTITVTGTGFTQQSTVTARGTGAGPAPMDVVTSFMNSGQLAAVIPASLLRNPGVLQIAVSTLSPGGGMSSPVPLTVLSAGTVSATNNPQVAKYAFSSPRDSTVTIEFGPDTSYSLHTWSQPTPPGGGEVDILVAGMRAFSTYHMRATVQFPEGTQFFDSDHVFATGGLTPDRVPQVKVTRPSSLTPNSGVELLDILTFKQPNFNPVQAAAVDLDGNLIWYYDFDDSAGQVPFPIKLLPNGHMMLIIGHPNGNLSLLREVDLAGNTVSELSIDELNAELASAGFNLPVNEIHHDFLLLPNGHLILLVNSFKAFTDLPGFPGTTFVLGDALVDLDPQRKPVWVWSTFDHLDVNRHPFGFSAQFADWTHGNAVIQSPDGNLILSLRNQNWILKIDYAGGSGSGNILWRLGPGGDFTLQNGGPKDWFYAQHAPSFVGSGTGNPFQLVLFDNGDNRVVDSNGDVCSSNPPITCYSRVPIVQFDEVSKTAMIVWQDILPLYSFFGGNAEALPNGNIEFAVAAASPIAPATAVMEVTQQTSPQVVWQLDITGQFSYRAFRIPSLYPGVEW